MVFVLRWCCRLVDTVVVVEATDVRIDVVSAFSCTIVAFCIDTVVAAALGIVSVVRVNIVAEIVVAVNVAVVVVAVPTALYVVVDDVA